MVEVILILNRKYVTAVLELNRIDMRLRQICEDDFSHLFGTMNTTVSIFDD